VAAIVGIGGIYAALVAADSAVYSTAVTELAPAARIGSAQALQAVAGFGIGSLGPIVAGIRSISAPDGLARSSWRASSALRRRSRSRSGRASVRSSRSIARDHRRRRPQWSGQDDLVKELVRA